MKQVITSKIKNRNGALLDTLEKAGESHGIAEYKTRKILRALLASLEKITKNPLNNDEMDKVEEWQKTLDAAYKARRKSHIAFQNARSGIA